MTAQHGPRPAFWIDVGYDRDNASDGASRYGAYVRSRLDWFRDAGCWEWPEAPGAGAARFAAVAWRIATGPVMAPGYARCHPRVLAHEVERSEWDGSLLARVDLITPWPRALGRSREWQDGKWWRDWPAETLVSPAAYYWPSGEDLAASPYLLASASLRFTVPAGRLPAPPVTGDDMDTLVQAAGQAAAAVAAELDRVAAPVLAALEGGG